MHMIFLQGNLRRFGGPYPLAVTTAAAAVRALTSQHSALADQLCYRHLRLISGPYRSGLVLSLPACYQPLRHRHLHLVPVRSGAGRSDGKLVLGMTLMGLSVLPGVSPGLAGLGGSGPASADLLSRQLLGSAGAFALRAALTAQQHSSAAVYGPQNSTSLIASPASTDEGRPVPLLYGRVRLTDPPVMSSALLVEARRL